MTFTATFFRRNPQSRNGGYNITRTIEAKTIKEAERYGYSQFELETELDRILSKVADNAYNCGLGLTSCD